MLVDMLGLSIGDLVFLYERQVGFHGVYKMASPLFFDTTSVSNSEGLRVDQQWPLRIRLECLYYFPKPVPEDLLFSTPHYETVFWIWAYRKSQGPRGCNTITPEAAEALMELLVKVNGRDTNRVFDPYALSKPQKANLPLSSDGERVALEDYLRGHILERLRDKRNIETIFGSAEDIEWFANNVPYHITQKNIDLLVFHKNFRYTTMPLRYKYSVAELKKDIAQAKDVAQLIRYSQWATGRLANGEVEMIQPILVANNFSDDAVKKATTTAFNDRGILLFRYIVQNQDIVFEKAGTE
jgi:hypothetical protein